MPSKPTARLRATRTASPAGVAPTTDPRNTPRLRARHQAFLRAMQAAAAKQRDAQRAVAKAVEATASAIQKAHTSAP